MPAAHDRNARFSGWRIVAFATITMALTGPGQTIGVSVFIDHFAADLDLEKSWITAGYLVGTLTGSLALPTIGRLVDQYGVRRAMTAVGAGFSLALVLMAGVQGIISLTAGFIFIRMLGQGSLSLVSVVSIQLWFERRRGTAISIAVTISAALMALVPVGLNAVIDELGWRAAWLVAAGVVGTVVLPIAWFGMIDRPADVGQRPDGDAPDPDESFVDVWGMERRDALRTYEFWVIAASTASVSMLITGLNFHQVALLGESGFTSAEAAALFLPQVLGSSIGSPTVGYALDRVGTRHAPLAAVALLTLTLLVAGSAATTPEVVGYAVLLGLTGGASRSISSTVMPAWFGVRHLGAIQGALSFVGVMASAAGPFAFSMTEIVADGYRPSARLWAVAPAVLLALLALRPPNPRRLRADQTTRLTIRPGT